MQENVLEVSSVSQKFTASGVEVQVLHSVSFSLAPGEVCALVGPSGSGKSTLLALSAGLDRPYSGSIRLCGVELTSAPEEELAKLRARSTGFVFQTFQLLPALTALENVMTPVEFAGERNARDRAIELLRSVGLEGRIHHYPRQLSGGEQQRVALARAFAARPKIVFADEPTGNLDAVTGEQMRDLLFSLNKEFGTALLIATHDPHLAERAGRALFLEAGRLV